jgi:hypothetical protein
VDRELKVRLALPDSGWKWSSTRVGSRGRPAVRALKSPIEGELRRDEIAFEATVGQAIQFLRERR